MFGLFSDSSTSMLAVITSALGGAGYVFFTAPFVLYVLARWRAHRDNQRDPQLGLKLAFGYIAIVAVHLALLGGVLLLYAIITKDKDDRGDVVRMAFGFLIPAIPVWFAHRMLLSRSNQETFPSVGKLLAGFQMLVVALIGFSALVVTFQALFAKGSSGEPGRFAVAALLVYSPAWAFNAWRVFLDRTGIQMPPPLEPVTAAFAAQPEPASSSDQTTTMTPPPPPKSEPPPGSSGSGLPPLGGGSFPPIGR